MVIKILIKSKKFLIYKKAILSNFLKVDINEQRKILD